MNCRKANRIMVKHLYGDLPEDVGRAVQNHLANCAGCGTRFEEFRQNRAAIVELADLKPQLSVAGAAVSRWNIEKVKNADSPFAAWARPLAWTAAATLCTISAIVAVTHFQRSNLLVAVGPEQHFAPQKIVRDRVSGVHRNPAIDGQPQNHLIVPRTRYSPASEQHHAQLSPGPVRDDLLYINTDTAGTIRAWSPAAARQASAQKEGPPAADDFVYLPHFRIVSTDPGAMSAAERAYQQEKAIVDLRLARRVDLAVKGIAFSDLAKQLEDETGIELRTARTVADEKITVFCEQTPLRDVMRQITHLFGYSWARTGDAPAYQYELFQDRKSQLAEEAMRTQDLNAALLALDEALNAYKPYLSLSYQDVLKQARAKFKPLNDQKTLKMPDDPLQIASSSGVLVAIHMFGQLTPAEQTALRNGQSVKFSTDDSAEGVKLPQAWGRKLLESFGNYIPFEDWNKGTTGTPYIDLPGASASITLSIDHSELGQLALNCESGVNIPMGGGHGSQSVLAKVRNPSAVKPDNRAANKALEREAAFQKEVSLNPRACEKPDIYKVYGIDPSKGIHIDDLLQAQVAPPTPHVNSADVWEEVHRQTGMPIVADYYTHLYPADSLVASKKPLFDALCQIGDSVSASWKKDGSFLQARSASFFWDKMKEVPNRLLDRWAKDREKNDGLPLDDLLQIAMLSDQQLDSVAVGQGVRHCLGIEEWTIMNSTVYGPKDRRIRQLARFLAGLPAGVRRHALDPDGVPLTSLRADQLAQLLVSNGLASAIGIRMHVDYVPSGRYSWEQIYESRAEAEKARPVVLAEKSPELALAAARRVHEGARPGDIRKSYGTLAVTFILPDGRHQNVGTRGPGWRIN